jgi:TonB family protein
MNCDDVSTIMDEHTRTRLSPSERCALDEHLAGCESCLLAWHAQTALLALPIPATPPSLFDGVLRAAAAHGSPRPAGRRARSRTVVAICVLAAGAALASAALVTVMQRARDGAAPASFAAPEGPADATSTARRAPSDGAAAGAAPGADLPEHVDVDSVPVVRTAPIYPPAALERKLEGWVQLKFTITATGTVEGVAVVDSSEPLFEPAAAQAMTGWRYLPRVVAGQRVASPGVHTTIRFALVPDAPPPDDKKYDVPQPSEDPRADALYAAYTGVERGIALAWERVAVEDLRGAELELDELRATYEIGPRQQVGLWTFYAYLYTQYRDYGRAIAAYESAIAIAETLPGGAGGGRIALANLYFARHQYDRALETLLAYKKSAGNAQYPEADAFIERLRALGVTEETL